MKPRPVRAAEFFPSISVILAARNEEVNLRRKIANLGELVYPKERMQWIVVSDGSTDGTNDLLRSQGEEVLGIVLETSGGKANALNAAVAQATGDILVFFDARQTVDAQAVFALTRAFADGEVGAVSGELMLETADGAAAHEALGIYWKIEKFVRKYESRSGSVIGVTGAIYAMRRELFRPMPPGTILDDVFVPMQVIRQGKRVIFEPAAIARDRLFSEKGKEFSRKVRTLTGNYQLIQMEPWLLSSSNPVLLRFLSHKLLRLVVPVFLVVLLFSSAFAQGALYRVLFVAQVCFYLLAIAGFLNHSFRSLRLVGVATTFLSLNLAATVACYQFFRGKKNAWAG